MNIFVSMVNIFRQVVAADTKIYTALLAGVIISPFNSSPSTKMPFIPPKDIHHLLALALADQAIRFVLLGNFL